VVGLDLDQPVDRQNLTIRMACRRFTRLRNGFSKKLEILKAALALHFARYDLVHIPPDAAGDSSDGDEGNGSNMGSGRISRLSEITPWLRAAGILILAIGVLCLPLGIGISPKRDLSVFSNLADAGLFIKAGLVIAAVGVFIFFLSFLLPDEHEP